MSLRPETYEACYNCANLAIARKDHACALALLATAEGTVGVRLYWWWWWWWWRVPLGCGMYWWWWLGAWRTSDICGHRC